jgi:molybdate transport system permease protein
MDFEALRLSLILSSATTILLVLIGIPIAYWLTTSTWRGKFIVEAIVALPLVLPPTVLGFYLLFALSPVTPLGGAFQSIFGHPFPFSFKGLVVASVIYTLPFAVQPFTAALAGVDPRLIEASHALGATRLRTFRSVSLPAARRGIIAGAVLTFAHTMGEFGIVLMVGGNIARETRTLSVSLFEQVESMQYVQAHKTAGLLLAVSFVVLIVVYGLQRRPSLRWPSR